VSLTSRPGKRTHGKGAVLLITVLTVTVVGLGLAVAPVAGATRTPYNTNLIKNGGFEAGAASTDGYSAVIVPNWRTIGNHTVVRYGTAGGFPTKAEAQRISGGTKFFASGVPDPTYHQCSNAQQRTVIRRRGGAIDSGHVAVVATARAGTYDHQTDTAVVTIQAWDKSGFQVTAQLTLPKVTASDGRLLRISGSMVLPLHTRSISVFLDSENTGGYCDAYFDKITLKLIRI
jgi:hypothetical protein